MMVVMPAHSREGGREGGREPRGNKARLYLHYTRIGRNTARGASGCATLAASDRNWGVKATTMYEGRRERRRGEKGPSPRQPTYKFTELREKTRFNFQILVIVMDGPNAVLSDGDCLVH